MESKQIKVNYKQTTDISEFDEKTRHLIEETIKFAQNSYSPYSNFKVSAALILESGELLKGTNVENASYPVSICAERTLVSHAVSNYPTKKIKTIAIYVDKETSTPVPPCGLCRQTLLEVEQRQAADIEIILISKNGLYLIFERCSDLLPLYFNGAML